MSLPPRPEVLADPGRRVPGLTVDALPYVDDELDAPGMRDAVNALIIEEMGRYAPPADGYAGEMRPLPPALVGAGGGSAALLTASTSSVLRSEYERLAADPTSVTQPRVGGPGHAAFPPAPTGAAAEDPAAWRAALDAARVAIEAQTLRGINVELGSRYAVEAWRGHTAQLDGLVAAARARVAAVAAQVDALNATRQAAQVGPGATGPRIKTLARRWDDTAAANVAAQLAVAEAEREVKRLRALAADAGLTDASAGSGDAGASSSAAASTS